MNPFEAVAANIPAPVRRKIERQEARAKTKAEQRLEEKDKLSKRFRAWERRQRDALHEAEPRAKDLLAKLKGYDMGQARQFLAEIEGTDWLDGLTFRQAAALYREIIAIVHRLRLVNGIEPGHETGALAWLFEDGPKPISERIKAAVIGDKVWTPDDEVASW